MKQDLNDIDPVLNVNSEITCRVDGSVMSLTGVGEKQFRTEAEANAFILGLETIAERGGTPFRVSEPVERFSEFVVRFATGVALEKWAS